MNKRGKRLKSIVNYKKGQTQISFGVIFSIILIITFIALAIYGITKFLDIQKAAQVGKFKSDFQADIDKMWRSTGNQTVYYYIPKKIEQVCFEERQNGNGKTENMYFIPDKEFGAYLLNNIDIDKTTLSLKRVSRSVPKTPCIDSVKGKITMVIGKNWNENAVTVNKPK